MKLLIAIRSEAIAELLASSLSKYDVHICHTGLDALRMLEALQPELLVLDLSLPIIDGSALLRRSRHKPMHVLALTGLATPAVLQTAAEAGVEKILLIPCPIRRIAEQLDALTEKAPSSEA